MSFRSFTAAIVAVAAATVATPSIAAPSDCATAPAQLRGAATTAAPDKQQRVLLLISAGERLCAADAAREADKKFAAAARALGVDMASLSTASAAR